MRDYSIEAELTGQMLATLEEYLSVRLPIVSPMAQR